MFIISNQLWINLPRNDEMMDSRYLEVRVEEIPQVSVLDGISITII